MRAKNALKLHNEDEVMLKKNNRVMRVVETKGIRTANDKVVVNVLLEDGEWYTHKEIS